MIFKLPDLAYDYHELEPYIDARTMEIHHTKHHGAYTSKLNDALKAEDKGNDCIRDIMKNISQYSTAVRNNGGGYYNHNLFWEMMSPTGGGHPSGVVADAINNNFGSFGNFKDEFANAAATRFGSGWVWLVKNNGKLIIGNTPNQDNPLMDISEFRGEPILALDVWEHAYYLSYQNRRPDYVEAFFNIINWKKVNELFLK